MGWRRQINTWGRGPWPTTYRSIRARFPQFTGVLDALEKNKTAIDTAAGTFRDAGSNVDSEFQGLSAFYSAPEAAKLFATTKPVKTDSDFFADQLESASKALGECMSRAMWVRASAPSAVEYQGTQIVCLDVYVDGIRNGLSQMWHPDGTLKLQGTVVNGVTSGEFLEWHPNGVLKSRKFFDDDIYSLKEESVWDEQGNLVREWHREG